MTEELSLPLDVLLGEDVVEGVLAVGQELAGQQGVPHEDGPHHRHRVEELAEAKVEVVLGVPGPEAEEVPGAGGWLEPPSQQVLHHRGDGLEHTSRPAEPGLESVLHRLPCAWVCVVVRLLLPVGAE